MKATDTLIIGERYTRRALSEMFGIRDASLNTGVFKPKFDDSIWLFITEKKTEDQTQYSDLLDGDYLAWDGQMSGRSDKLIRNHKSNNLDLLVFYRKKKRQFNDSAFIYEGPFEYVAHEGSNPTHFTLRRVLFVGRLRAADLFPRGLQEIFEDSEDGRILVCENQFDNDKK